MNEIIAFITGSVFTFGAIEVNKRLPVNTQKKVKEMTNKIVLIGMGIVIGAVVMLVSK